MLREDLGDELAAAIDAANGETLWIYRMDEGERGRTAPRQTSGRGVSYWNDGTDERILFLTQKIHAMGEVHDGEAGAGGAGRGVHGVLLASGGLPVSPFESPVRDAAGRNRGRVRRKCGGKMAARVEPGGAPSSGAAGRVPSDGVAGCATPPRVNYAI